MQARDTLGNTSGWLASGAVSVQAVTKYYAYGGKPVAVRQGTGTAGPLTYLAGDHLGSVKLATSAAWAMVSDARYTASAVFIWGAAFHAGLTRQDWDRNSPSD